jgi:hypothetical protein
MSKPWKKAFLTALENTGTIRTAAKAANVHYTTVYREKKDDPDFAAAWENSIEVAADTLEDEARKRAFAGSDVLLIFLLKGMRPEKFRESRSTIPPAELNKMIETELQRIAKQKEVEALEPVKLSFSQH